MRLNQLIFLIASTVILGAIAGIVTTIGAFWIHVPWFIGLITGAFLATTSLMGFWAYLTLNFIASITLPRRVWRWTQALLLAVVLYDMLWWRYHIDVARHPSQHGSLTLYLVQGLWPLGVAIAASVVKQRMSGKGSFLPSLFYLYVFTVVDWLLVIRVQHGPIVNETGAIMILCNIYLLLLLGKLLSPVAERAAWAAEAEVRIQSRQAAKAAVLQAKADKKARKKARRKERRAERLDGQSQ